MKISDEYISSVISSVIMTYHFIFFNSFIFNCDFLGIYRHKFSVIVNYQLVFFLIIIFIFNNFLVVLLMMNICCP